MDLFNRCHFTSGQKTTEALMKSAVIFSQLDN